MPATATISPKLFGNPEISIMGPGAKTDGRMAGLHRKRGPPSQGARLPGAHATARHAGAKKEGPANEALEGVGVRVNSEVGWPKNS